MEVDATALPFELSEDEIIDGIIALQDGPDELITIQANISDI